MWMMGCNGVGGFNNSDSFNRRKLRPLIPKPSPPTTITSTSNGNITTNNIPILSNPPCLTRLHGTDLFLFNNHLSTVSEQSKGSEFMVLSPSTTTTTVASSRWNPTPEQLSTLEELYRRGTRTPTADQIQHITAQLRRYGKIEGKNVFYWFQNHKARERQKRRRKSSELETSNITTNGEEKHQTHGQIGLLERNESGGSRRTGYEVEQTKNWQQLSTNCSTLSKEAVSMQGRATVVSESKTDGCFQLKDYDHQIQEFQHSRSSHLHATWHMMNLSSSSSHLINPTTTTTKTLARSTTTDTHPQLRILFQPKFIHSNINDYQKSNTLELFPLLPKEEDGNDTGNDEIMITGKEKEHLPNIPMVNTTTPYQFIEFL